VQHLIGEHQVNNSFFVYRWSKVLVVAARKAGPDAVVNVHHTCDTVESEAIELIFIHPKPEVGEEESKDLMMAVVEEATVPELMTALGALVEVAVIGAVEHIQSIENVLACMGMDDVKQDSDAHSMGGVDEFHELFRGSW